MKELLEDFIKETKRKDIIRPLIKDSSFIITMKSEKETLFIRVKDEQLHLINQSEVIEGVEVSLFGSEVVFEAILAGKTKLREAIHQNKVNITSSFRNTLLLDAVFFLSKSQLK